MGKVTLGIRSKRQFDSSAAKKIAAPAPFEARPRREKEKRERFQACGSSIGGGEATNSGGMPRSLQRMHTDLLSLFAA
jgi:hypothetical protein